MKKFAIIIMGTLAISQVAKAVTFSFDIPASLVDDAVDTYIKRTKPKTVPVTNAEKKNYVQQSLRALLIGTALQEASKTTAKTAYDADIAQRKQNAGITDADLNVGQ